MAITTLGEIAEFIGGELLGDPEIVIKGVSGIKEAQSGDITFLANQKYNALIEQTQASAVIVANELATTKALIKVSDPSLAFSKVIKFITGVELKHPCGIDPRAVVADTACLGLRVSVGACAVVEAEAVIGDGSIIYPGCFIGRQAKIGQNCLIYPNVTILERNIIGDRVVIHSGTVVGSDGFGFAEVEGVQEKIPQVGIVVIEDDVEIGANVTIDRARFDKTLIGRGTKIDNLVQIAHNVIVGSNCVIVAQTGISGSVKLGKNIILAGQSGIVGHVAIGDKAVIAARTVVTKSLPGGTIYSGFPAKPHSQAKRIQACIQQLPQLYEKVKQLKEKFKK